MDAAPAFRAYTRGYALDLVAFGKWIPVPCKLTKIDKIHYLYLIIAKPFVMVSKSFVESNLDMLLILKLDSVQNSLENASSRGEILGILH